LETLEKFKGQQLSGIKA